MTDKDPQLMTKAEREAWIMERIKKLEVDLEAVKAQRYGQEGEEIQIENPKLREAMQRMLAELRAGRISIDKAEEVVTEANLD